VLAIVLGCILAPPAIAALDLPPVVTDGMEAYQKAGPHAAMAAWLKGSLIANGEAASEVERTLSEVESTHGKMIGFELMHTVIFSASSQRLYFLLKFEKGPGYIVLDCYLSPAGWIIPLMDFNLRPERVLPKALFAH
jgi:hypothetical protein